MEMAAGFLQRPTLPELSKDIIFMATDLSDFMCLVPGISLVTHDLSGNMVFITDDTGAVAAKFSYTPFGEVLDRTIGNPACDIPIGFAGAFGVLREPNGLYYMNARYYDPTVGRFLSEDPLGLGGGDLTLYSYAGNNPVVFVDPSGLCASNSVIRGQCNYSPAIAPRTMGFI